MHHDHSCRRTCTNDYIHEVLHTQFVLACHIFEFSFNCLRTHAIRAPTSCITAVSRRQLSFPNGKLGMGMGIRQQIYDLTALSLRPRHCKEDETLLLDSSHPVKVGCTLKIVDYGFPFCK